MRYYRTENCGVYGIAGLYEFSDTPRRFLKEVATKSNRAGGCYWRYPGMILFSDASLKSAEAMPWARRNRTKGTTSGERLRDFITKHGLGTVTETPWVHNPNSGNDIKHFQWAVDTDAMEKFIAELPRTEAAFAKQYLQAA